MMRDFFSHKIHSASADWPDKLVELAGLFGEFEGMPFDRDALEQRLEQIGPRAAYAPRDRSIFRDEISAYPAYLGLYYLEPSPQGWIVRLSEAARQFLLREEPDVAAFLRLQLTLFQYPNGSGAAYVSGTNKLRMQANAASRTLGLIGNGVHLAPLRLICKALKADAQIRDVHVWEGVVAFGEVYALANYPITSRSTCPPDKAVRDALRQIRVGIVPLPTSFEPRFHLLKHTDLFDVGRGRIRLRETSTAEERDDLLLKLSAIANTRAQFAGFDSATCSDDIAAVLRTTAWGQYYDGMKSLSADVVGVLASDVIRAQWAGRDQAALLAAASAPKSYPLSVRPEVVPPPRRTTRAAERADPDAARIKRERRTLVHKELVDRIDRILRNLGASPLESPHIDLYANIPGDGSFMFEMKSGGENVLEQIRKGLSQLYEYRYRYADRVAGDTTLCLVLPGDPSVIAWVTDYLCDDRRIALCWFDREGGVRFPEACSDVLGVLGAQTA